jgi:mRNA export factor
MFDIATGQATQVAQHDAPVKTVKWVDTPQGGILATGSWDKTIKVCQVTSVALILLKYIHHG